MTTSFSSVGSGVPSNAEPRPDFLVRFGTEYEYAPRLEKLSEAATAVGLPHGVSVFQNIAARSGSSVALHRAVEAAGFPVVKTGRAKHYTVVLPHPVTEEAAERFNAAFGRHE